MVNEHNSWITRDFWLEDWEKQAIINFYMKHSRDGYRRVTFMLMDKDIVAVSPSSVYRVLKEAGLLRKWNRKKSKKGTGFHQPSGPHKHWHIDVSYINILGTLKRECIRPKTPLSLEEAQRVVAEFVEYYNTVRLHRAIGYIAPLDKLEGRAEEIFASRERKLEKARKIRKMNRSNIEKENLTGKEEKEIVLTIGETEAGYAGKQPARDNRSGFWHKTSEGTVFVPSTLMNNANSSHA